MEDVFEYYKKLASELHAGDLVLLRTCASDVGDESTNLDQRIETYILKWSKPKDDDLVKYDTEYCRDTPQLTAQGEILKLYRFSSAWDKQISFVPVGHYNSKTRLTAWSPCDPPEKIAVGKKAVFAALDKYGLTEFKKPLLKIITKLAKKNK